MREPRQYEAPLCAEVDGDIWFLNRVQTIEFSVSQKVSAEDAHINLNALNGVYIKNDSESGADLLHQISCSSQTQNKIAEESREGCA